MLKGSFSMEVFQKMHSLFFVGAALVLSQISARLATSLGAPRLIGYLLMGVVLGPSLLNLVGEEHIQGEFRLLSEVALTVIAFSIGSAMEFSRLKKLLSQVLGITLFEAAGAFIFVLLCSLVFLPFLLPPALISGSPQIVKGLSLLLAAVAIPTAPAAVLSLAHELKAKGPFTSIVLGVVALDDVLAVLAFGFAFALAAPLLGGSPAGFTTSFLLPASHLLISILLGFGLSLTALVLMSMFGSQDTLLGLIFGLILLAAGIAHSWNVSGLIPAMILGFVIFNFSSHGRGSESRRVIENIEEPIFGVFFLISGMHFDFSAMESGALIAVMLLLSRFAGKILGVYLGGKCISAEKNVRDYLGITLLPSAGVAIGLILSAETLLHGSSPELANLIVSAVVGSTLINELVTPFLVRYAFLKVGEGKRLGRKTFSQPEAYLGRLGGVVGHRKKIQSPHSLRAREHHLS